MTSNIGPYELRGELGRGAMAIVWRAWDPNLEREVAIKEPVIAHGIAEETRLDLGARFVREGKAAAGLNHPGIVTVYAADSYDGRPAIVMELIEGNTLGEILERGALAPESALGILDQLLDAVAFAHSRGVVHRDIKPDNVFVTADGRVKLTDFGIAHVGSTATLTQAGTVMGTPGYMAPEQVTGQPADARADLFSIGVLGYEMMTGQNPFGATDGGAATTVMYRIVHEDPPALAVLVGLPADISQVIAIALAKLPQDRFADANEFRAALRGQLHRSVPGTIGMAAPAVPVHKATNHTAIYASVAAFGVVAVVALLMFSGVGNTGGGAAPPPTGPGETQVTDMTVALEVSPEPSGIEAGESVAIEVVPSVPSAVANVTLTVDGVQIGSTGSAPYSFTHTFSSEGSYEIVAEVSGSGGQAWRSDVLTAQVAATEASEEEAVTALIDEWIGSFSRLDLDGHMACYAPVVDTYFASSNKSNGEIRADKIKGFTKSYSVSEMSVSNVQVTITGADSAEAVFDKAWNFVSSSVFAGEEQQRLRFRKYSGEWKIVSEEELEIYWVKRQ